MARDSSSSTRHHYESGEKTTTTVSLAVSEATKTDIVDIPPLYEFVNPDSVNRLFDSGESDGEIGTRVLEFRTFECRVRIDSDEQTVTVSPGERIARPEFHRHRRFQTHSWDDNDDFHVNLIEAASPTGEPEAENDDPTLPETIDSDSLSRLFRPVTDDTPRDSGWFSFTLGERTVVVEAWGRITSTNTAREPNGVRCS
jgi:hypothetical protein